jgi:hypothetical protein
MIGTNRITIRVGISIMEWSMGMDHTIGQDMRLRANLIVPV